MNREFGFLTRADLLIRISGVVQDFTTKDVSVSETQEPICFATAATRSSATVVRLAKEAIRQVLAVLSDPSDFS